MISVMLVDDQEMIRVGLNAVLSSFEDITVAAVCSDGLAALDVLDEVAPDVVLLDIRMPGIDGIETVRRIRARREDGNPRILMLTTFEQEENVMQALRAGANGFLNKSVGPSELAGAIRELAAGSGALSGAAAAAVIARVTQEPAHVVDPVMVDRFQALTAREFEIVRKLLLGDTYDDVAKRMFLSRHTVKTHANRAMSKVGASDRAQLVAFATRAGITAEADEA